RSLQRHGEGRASRAAPLPPRATPPLGTRPSTPRSPHVVVDGEPPPGLVPAHRPVGVDPSAIVHPSRWRRLLVRQGSPSVIKPRETTPIVTENSAPTSRRSDPLQRSGGS